MGRAAAAVGAVVIAVLALPATGTPDTGIPPLTLTAAAAEPGWISLAAAGPDGAPVEVSEIVAGAGRAVAHLTLSGGLAQVARALPWRCERRARRFVATTATPGGAPQTATATITTPSCAGRLRMIVVPGELRPGQAASVSVTDTWHLGAIAATLCARPRGACARVRVKAHTTTRRARVRLLRPGRATLILRSAHGQRLRAHVDVRDDARLRVVVTGDSMVFGLGETLARDVGRRGLVRGDGNPGFGISDPGFDWPAHARALTRSARPDVTVVLVAGADGGYPLKLPGGGAAPCCELAWQAEYARRVRGMMATFLRGGHGLVYWVLVPAVRSPARARVVSAANSAVRVAAAAFDDGVRVIDRVAGVLTPDDEFRESIRVGGRMRVVRDPDGVHFTNLGIRIAVNVLKDALRGDGLLTSR